MAVNLDATRIDTQAAEFARMLENLQCNILKSHGRNHARLLGLRLTGTRASARAWLRAFGDDRVTSARTQFEQIRVYKATGRPGETIATLALSAAGYRFLGLDADRFRSRAFRRGMKDRGFDLADAVAGVGEGVLEIGNKDPEPETWDPGYRGDVHCLVLLADDDPARLDAEVSRVRASLAGVAAVAASETGVTLRRGNQPVEHFGYLDGRSNPVFTREDWEKELASEGGNIEGWDPSAPLGLALVEDPFGGTEDAFGSYLVFRKLRQDVAGFDRRVSELAASLGVSPELAGAFVVGRFKDGSPVVAAGSPGAGARNAFNYDGDPRGSRCPFHAHIRKTNPRGTTPLTSLEDERRRRIVRRGIPYGRPLPGTADEDPAVPADPDPAADRGLLFLCFQRDIAAQFEFIQRVWVDNPNFPRPILPLPLVANTGDDPLIGQDRKEPQRWPTSWGDDDREKVNFESLVTLAGGEYLFCPSLPFLRSL